MKCPLSSICNVFNKIVATFAAMERERRIADLFAQRAMAQRGFVMPYTLFMDTMTGNVTNTPIPIREDQIPEHITFIDEQLRELGIDPEQPQEHILEP